MELDPYISELSESLETAAAAGDEATRQTAALLAAALAPSARLALMNALSDLAAEVTDALDGPTVELRLDGRDVNVVVSASEWSDAAPEPAALPPQTDAGGETSRITLRLLEVLKEQAETAAAQQGVSLNNWLTWAVQTGLNHAASHHANQSRNGQNPQHQGGRRGSRLSGWVTG
jgi:hypothetical protein